MQSPRVHWLEIQALAEVECHQKEKKMRDRESSFQAPCNQEARSRMGGDMVNLVNCMT